MNLRGGSELPFALLIACCLKATILLALTWIVVGGSRHQSAAFRHRVWAMGVLGLLTLPSFDISACLALGSAGEYHGPMGPSAHNSRWSQFPDIPSNDGRREGSIFASRQLGQLGTVSLGSRLLILCHQARRGSCATCMDIRTR